MGAKHASPLFPGPQPILPLGPTTCLCDVTTPRHAAKLIQRRSDWPRQLGEVTCFRCESEDALARTNGVY